MVQCSGSMTYLAKMMEEAYAIPFKRVSYFGIEDTAEALYTVARHFDDPEVLERTEELVRTRGKPDLSRSAAVPAQPPGKEGGHLRGRLLQGVLPRQGAAPPRHRHASIVGSQTGNQEDYEYLREICDEGTIIVDDTNPLELSKFMMEKGVDLLIGGVKERPIAYKMGVGILRPQPRAQGSPRRVRRACSISAGKSTSRS